MFSKTEMSEVLTEICKMDPNFDKELFIRDCRDDIIPNVLEAMIRGDLEILEDWCHEAVSPFEICAAMCTTNNVFSVFPTKYFSECLYI